VQGSSHLRQHLTPKRLLWYKKIGLALELQSLLAAVKVLDRPSPICIPPNSRAVVSIVGQFGVTDGAGNGIFRPLSSITKVALAFNNHGRAVGG
jgi:hypothetical protein